MLNNVDKDDEGIMWSRGTAYWRLCLALVYAGTIFVFSSIPGEHLPSLTVNDKLLHAIEFGCLTLLVCRALHAFAPAQTRYRIAVIGIVVAICYGIVDEAHQLLVAHRVADIADLAADGLGALLIGWGWWAGARWSWL
jgi:VanZ family protein